MEEFFKWLTYTPFHSLYTAATGGAIAVLLEFRRHTWATAFLALASGTFVAYIATSWIIEAFSLPGSAEHAVAGVLGITGRNLIVWVLQTSKDPLKAWKGRK